jgi:hypothetical protein
MQIPALRLRNQFLAKPHRGSAVDVVSRLGAVQSQEYAFAKWALALRLAGKKSDTDIEAAIDRGDILRTHILRPTWHFVTAGDILWMQALTAPRVHLRLATYLPRLGVEKRWLTKAIGLFERALAGGHYLTRTELQARLARSGIVVKGTALAMVIMHAELEGILCSGPRRGKQFTYALIRERAPKARLLDRDQALNELARRFFTSHGPATIRDFVWWSSLSTADARRGVDMIKAKSFEHGGLTYWTCGPARATPPPKMAVHLLPIYDEYVIAYRDRVAVPHGRGFASFGALAHALSINGEIAGMWTTDRTTGVHVQPWRTLSSAEWKAIEREVERLGHYWETRVP